MPLERRIRNLRKKHNLQKHHVYEEKPSRNSSHTVSADEGSHLIKELDKIKNKYFVNNV
jgi:hypothetical protein